ncbi:hypothetical protein GCM10009554_32760 [Kribbella koreensis]|uniref:Uncharacterized protein n=2 Tax=Kribbella koreensis TaxID=57909 RepID=A0ABP4AU68_9ACTN
MDFAAIALVRLRRMVVSIRARTRWYSATLSGPGVVAIGAVALGAAVLAEDGPAESGCGASERAFSSGEQAVQIRRTAARPAIHRLASTIQ